MTEEWEPITNYEGYDISNTGRVRSSYRILKQQTDYKGYLTVGIKGKQLKVARLVAQAFIPNNENKLEVNHKNGIKIDNRIKNLEWCTAKENTTHAWRTGLHKNDERDGINNSQHKLTAKQVRIIKHTLSFKTRGVQKWLAKMCGISQGQISRINKGDYWNNNK